MLPYNTPFSPARRLDTFSAFCRAYIRLCYSTQFQSGSSRLASRRMLVSNFTQVLREFRCMNTTRQTGQASARCAAAALIRRYDRVPLAGPIRLSRLAGQSRRTGRRRRRQLDQRCRLIYDSPRSDAHRLAPARSARAPYGTTRADRQTAVPAPFRSASAFGDCRVAVRALVA